MFFHRSGIAICCFWATLLCAAEAAELMPLPEAKVLERPSATAQPEGDQLGALTIFADSDLVIGFLPLQVQLSVEVLPRTGLEPYRYQWDFGDGTSFSKEQNPRHTYLIPGSFRASVVVLDGRRELDQDYVDISVERPHASLDIPAAQLDQWLAATSGTAVAEVPQ